MIRTSLQIALVTGLLTGAAASNAAAPDLDRVAEALDALQTSVNNHDFDVLEPRLDESFSYQGRNPDISRMIMRQVVQGYPGEIREISILDVTADGNQWSVGVNIEDPQETRHRVIRLDADYRILQADIADIQLAGHDERPARRDKGENLDRLQARLQFPFDVRNGQIVVQAAINGVAGNFLVDTGAQATTVNTAHFTAELRTVELDHGMPSGVGGAIRDIRLAPGLQLTWGDMRLDEVRGLAFDLSHLEASMGIPIVGLIGFDVLERFEIYFDYKARLLTLYRLDEDNRPVDTGPRERPSATLAFDMVGHIPVFPASVSGQALRLGLDSGAAEAMLAEKWQDPMSGKFELVRIAEMRGGDKAVRPSPEVRFDSLTVNNIVYQDAVFRFNDILLASGNTLDMDGLLGYQFLSTRPTSINFRARQLSIW